MLKRFRKKPTPAAPPAAPRRAPPPLRRNYALGSEDRLTNDFYAGSLTADQAVYGAIRIARNRARDLERNNPYVRKFLSMIDSNVVGSKGIRLQSLASDFFNGKEVPNKFDRQIIEENYKEFSRAENFTINGKLNRRRFAQMVMRRQLIDGECIILKHKGSGPFGIQYQIIDAERLDYALNREATQDKNEIRMGIELDQNERPVAYYFLDEAPTIWAGVSHLANNHTEVPADDVIHIFSPDRPGQTRGFTHFAPAGLRAKLLDGVETAVTVGFKVAASKMGFFKKTKDYEPVDGEEDIETPQDVSPGELWELPEGMEFVDFDPSYPSADFDGFKKSLIREIAAGMGVSYPELGNDFGGVSYSAGQIGVHSDMAFYSNLQENLIEDFEEKIFREYLFFAITAGVLRLPMSRLYKFHRAKFQPPRRKHIDPLKTHNAQRVALGDMSRSPFDVAAENGVDFEDIVEDTRRAIDLLEAQGLPIPESWAAGTDLSQTQEPPEPTDPA